MKAYFPEKGNGKIRHDYLFGKANGTEQTTNSYALDVRDGPTMNGLARSMTVGRVCPNNI
jgi:hypothetical protein